MEYESYYYVKFAKYPKITKKLTSSGKTQLSLILEQNVLIEEFLLNKYMFICFEYMIKIYESTCKFEEGSLMIKTSLRQTN